MKQFLRKIIVISLLFSAGISVFIFCIHGIVKSQSNFLLSSDTKYIILGHSHPECAFNDNLIDNAKNLSKGGEGYFYNYQKAKEILSENKIDAVFIEYTNNHIESRMDDWIWGYEKMNTYLPKHAPFMSIEDLSFLYKKNSKDFIRVISTSTLKNFIRVLTFDYSINSSFGGYQKLERTSVVEGSKKKSSEEMAVASQNKVSSNNLVYLDKIVDYCYKNKVKLYFVRSPQHKKSGKYNEEKLSEIKETRYKGIEFLDFDNYPIDDDGYADFGHLNYTGAKEFSSWFNHLVKKGLLKNKNKELFVKEEIIKAIRIKSEGEPR